MSYRDQAVAELKAQIKKFNAEREYLESNPPDLEVDQLVEQYQNTHSILKLSYAEAMQKVLALNPELAKRFGTGMNEKFAEEHPSVNFQVRE